MAHFTIFTDRETSNRVGYSDAFQVVSVSDVEGNELDNAIDCGQHFTSLNEVKGLLATKFNLDLNAIEIEEV